MIKRLNFCNLHLQINTIFVIISIFDMNHNISDSITNTFHTIGHFFLGMSAATLFSSWLGWIGQNSQSFVGLSAITGMGLYLYTWYRKVRDQFKRDKEDAESAKEKTRIKAQEVLTQESFKEILRKRNEDFKESMKNGNVDIIKKKPD